MTDTTTTRSDIVEDLISRLTLEEKVAQLYGVWVGANADGGDVAPNQHELTDDVDLDEIVPLGLGQLTRPFGTVPVDPALGALSLLRLQQRLVAESSAGIPAQAHEECLAGFAAWGATAYPVPLSWGASFAPELVERMAERIGADMASVGIHQGLAPVLDVVRDARWGRVEETIGEDPYLIGTVGAAYVRGLESAGIVATLKHFVGYSASRTGRNLAPVSMGPRERADVMLQPFEMVLRDGKPRSVMNAYTDIDGVPSAGDRALLTDLLRGEFGFDGVVVADYFAVAFLQLHHRVVGSIGEAAALALEAGIDVELPTVRAYGAPLLEEVRSGRLSEDVIDLALRRVLRQKAELGLLDPDWDAVPPALAGKDLSDPESLRGTVDLDPPVNRAIARELAEQSVILLRNEGVLPLAAPARIAVVGPTGDDYAAVMGCYSFPLHVGAHHPEVPVGIEIATLLESVRAEFPDAEVTFVEGTSISGGETDGIPAAVDAARAADVVILALGDRAGLFGRGTSGEGCDVESLDLPGAQAQLLDAVLDAGTPVVLTLLAGRPYHLGRAVDSAAAIVQTFFPGEEGTGAIAGVLSGRVNPSGRLPVSVPASPGAQPTSYLASPLARTTGVSSVSVDAAYPFGHGLSYSTFEWTDAAAERSTIGTDGTARLTLTVRNTGSRAGAEVVQVYLEDPVASVVRPVQRLVGFRKVALEPGEALRLTVDVPADLAAFTGLAGDRIVEPGELIVGFGRSSGDIPLTVPLTLDGPVRVVGTDRALHPAWTEERVAG
jgi:Beta-glucosidase-related glycosidases